MKQNEFRSKNGIIIYLYGSWYFTVNGVRTKTNITF